MDAEWALRWEYGMCSAASANNQNEPFATTTTQASPQADDDHQVAAVARVDVTCAAT
jgi:hypothetical protein